MPLSKFLSTPALSRQACMFARCLRCHTAIMAQLQEAMRLAQILLGIRNLLLGREQSVRVIVSSSSLPREAHLHYEGASMCNERTRRCNAGAASLTAAS